MQHAKRAHDRETADDNREAGCDQTAEDDHEQQQDQRQREHLRARQVLLGHVVDGLLGGHEPTDLLAEPVDLELRLDVLELLDLLVRVTTAQRDGDERLLLVVGRHRPDGPEHVVPREAADVVGDLLEFERVREVAAINDDHVTVLPPERLLGYLVGPRRLTGGSLVAALAELVEHADAPHTADHGEQYGRDQHHPPAAICDRSPLREHRRRPPGLPFCKSRELL